LAAWKRLESKVAIESCCLFILRLDDYREDSERAGGRENAPDSIGQQEVANALAANALIAREAPDQRRRNKIVPREAFGMLRQQIDDCERECAETIKPDYTKSVVDRNENASHIALLVLASAKMKPIIQRRDTAGERTPFVLPERFDGCDHNRSTEETAVVPESLDEARGWLGVALNRSNKCVAIRAQQNHALMFFQQPARAFVSQIASRKPGNGHGLMNNLLHRGSHPQLQSLRLEFPLLRSWFPGRCGLLAGGRHGGSPANYVRHFSVQIKTGEIFGCSPQRRTLPLG
jgi:hypothetical protein